MARKQCLTLAFFASALIAPPGAVTLIAADDDLDVLRTAHVASREAIQTCSFQFEQVWTNYRMTPPKDTRGNGEYWRSRGDYRLKTREGDDERDHFLQNSVLRVIFRKRDPAGNPVVSAYKDAEGELCLLNLDPWGLLLLSLPVPNTIGTAPVDRLIKKASSRPSVTRAVIAGTEFTVVRLECEPSNPRDHRWLAEIHFDPKVNYLVRRYVLRTRTPSPSEIERVHEVVRFAEGSPGVFFPEHAEQRVTENGKHIYTRTIHIQNLRVNKPLAPNALAFRFPQGLEITDRIRNTRYQVDGMGHRMSEEKPWNPQKVTIPFVKGEVGGVPAYPASEGGVRSETVEEAGSITGWVILGSVSALVLAGAIALVRRWKSS